MPSERKKNMIKKLKNFFSSFFPREAPKVPLEKEEKKEYAPPVQHITIHNNTGNVSINMVLPAIIILNPYERIAGLFLRTRIESSLDEEQIHIQRKIWEIIDHDVFLVQTKDTVNIIKKAGEVEQLVPVSGKQVTHSVVLVSYILGKMFDTSMEEISQDPQRFFVSLKNKKIEIKEIPVERVQKILSMV